MDIKEKLYQMFILGTEGGGYKTAMQQGLGGIIFFTRDIINSQQFTKLVEDIKSIALIPPFLSIDQEGGRVERTENIHNGKKYLSAKYAYEKGEEFLRRQTKDIAAELKSYGLNLNFAPCIDVNTNPDNPIIGERAFSSDADGVINGAHIVSTVYQENGIIPCAKHYPGHGDANTDSHLTLPEIDIPLAEMEKTHIKPFIASVHDGIGMIMAAHLHCTCFEKSAIPTSLSKKALSYLRNNIGFDGVIISDDMIMKGVANFGLQNACEMGIRAGLNMFIYRYSSPDIINMIENVAQKALTDPELYQNIEFSYEKIMELKQKSGLLNKNNN